MKKCLLLLFTVALLLTLALPVMADTEAVTFTVGDVSASRGSDVVVTVDVSGNTGMAGVVLTLGYDTTALTLKHYENGTVYSTAPEVGINYVWTESGKNTTENGTLLTLVFTVNDAAAEGQAYPISLTVRECSDIDRRAVQTAAVHGSIRVSEPSSTITQASVTLGKDISVNYYAVLDEAHRDAQMKFTMNGKETLVNGVPTANNHEYIYTFQGVSPQCMGDNIKAELMLNNRVLDVKDTYSVREYCSDILEQEASDLHISEEACRALKQLIADLLEYGAMAQVYQGYKTDALVNEGITTQREFVALSPEDCDEILEQGSNFTLTGVEFVAAGIYFDYYNALYVKFNAPGVTDSNFRIRLKDTEENILATYTLSDCSLISEESSTYLLILPPLSATQCNDFFIVELCKYSARATTMQWSLNYGIPSYVCAKQHQTNGAGELTGMAKLSRALYTYGLSAQAYQAINK